jgi:hypothetical protein
MGCKAVCHLAGHKGSIFLFRAVWLQTIEAALWLFKLFCHCVAFPLPPAASGSGCRQGRHASAHLKPAELLGWFGFIHLLLMQPQVLLVEAGSCALDRCTGLALEVCYAMGGHDSLS